MDSLYLELARDQQICSRQRKFEIEKITVNIEIFPNKTIEANKGLFDVSDIKFKCSEKFLLKILYEMHKFKQVLKNL